ncbi:glutamate mutase L [Micromonospora sp. NPDC049230]|uniref:glutamate mutase L n=1 Tax=Micromonospora sp. NPDC049230 TaxID=3155502 RepID=UPI0033F36256
MTPAGTLLVDVGSTVLKVCTRWGADRFSAVERVPRLAGISPGDQVCELVARRRSSGVTAVRVCSSAKGGVPVGVLGLSGRHSVAAAARATVAAGGNVRYERVLTDPSGPPAPAVDVLVLTGGVDGADHHRLRGALAGARLADHPHEILVWAGADAPEVTALLPPHRTATNILDRHLRPRPAGLTELIRDIYTSDLVGRKGLAAPAAITEAPIWPTPAVVGLAAERMSRRRLLLPGTATPFVLLDVGGATTDAFVCAELRRGHPVRVTGPDSSVVRHVFTDLGVVASAPALLGRLAADPGLFDLVRAVAPERSRGLHHDLCSGDVAALTPPVGFLCCVFLALRRLAAADGPHLVDLGRAASVVVTGGARSGASTAQIRRVVDAVAGRSDAPRTVAVDNDYLLWAYGIQDVPAWHPVR